MKYEVGGPIQKNSFTLLVAHFNLLLHVSPYHWVPVSEAYMSFFTTMLFFYTMQVMYNAVLENACSEQGARMSAMDSSSRNAGDMLDRLTLTYNRSLFLSLLHTCLIVFNIQFFSGKYIK